MKFFSKLTTNKRAALTIFAALLMIGFIVLIFSFVGQKNTAYKDKLRDQVTDQEGAPRNGRDPATQQQNSLASTASKPNGTGQPATNSTTKKDEGQQNKHDDQEAIGRNGCYTDYGVQGEQCLPAHAAMGGPLTCDGVKSHGFPNGIAVTGTDRFKLDTNHDGTACGKGD